MGRVTSTMERHDRDTPTDGAGRGTMSDLCQWEVCATKTKQSAGIWFHDERTEATEAWKELHEADPGSGWRIRRVWEGDPKFRKVKPRAGERER